MLVSCAMGVRFYNEMFLSDTRGKCFIKDLLQNLAHTQNEVWNKI